MEKMTIASILDILYVDDLREICHSYDLQPIGNKIELIKLIIQNVKPASRIIEDFKVEELKVICSSLNLKTANKAQMQKELFEILDLEKTGIITEEIPKLEPTADNVISKLRELVINKRRIENETNAKDEIGKHLSMYFRDVMPECTIGGIRGLKIDLDINEGKFGIEVKLANSFLEKTTNEVYRVFGQAVYYTKKKYGEDFLVAIVGTEDDLDEPIVREVMSFLGSINIKCLGIIMR